MDQSRGGERRKPLHHHHHHHRNKDDAGLHWILCRSSSPLQRCFEMLPFFHLEFGGCFTSFFLPFEMIRFWHFQQKKETKRDTSHTNQIYNRTQAKCRDEKIFTLDADGRDDDKYTTRERERERCCASSTFICECRSIGIEAYGRVVGDELRRRASQGFVAAFPKGPSSSNPHAPTDFISPTVTCLNTIIQLWARQTRRLSNEPLLNIKRIRSRGEKQ